jgi:nitrogen regulatory protein P-II 1
LQGGFFLRKKPQSGQRSQKSRIENAITALAQEITMTKVEAIIRPNKFESVKTALIQMGVEGMTVSEVRGHGRQKGHTEVFKGREYSVDLLPKIKLELVLDDAIADKVIDSILATAYTGSIGDGKIFVYNVSDVIRIRSRERGVVAI